MSKWSVMIIDDKSLIREALTRTIAWEKLGCTVVGEAENGLEGKKMITQKKPDIIISDIRMPGMDGLELAEFVKDFLPQSRVIIITGYQEFEYAKRALQLGVQEFLLKPLDNKNVEEVLTKIITQMEIDRDKLKYEVKNLQMNTLLEGISRRRDLAGLTESELDRLGLSSFHFLIVVARVRSSRPDILSKMTKEVCLLMLEYETRYETKVLDMVVNQDIVFFLFLDTGTSTRQHNTRIRSHLRYVNVLVKEEYKTVCCFVVSQVSTQLQKAADCFEQALAVLNSCYFTSEEDILFSNNYNLLKEAEAGSIIRDLDKFYSVIEGISDSEIEKEIGIIIFKIGNSTKGNEFQIKCLLSEICITIMRHYDKVLSGSVKYENGINRMIQEIDSLTDIKAGKDYLVQYVESIRSLLNERKKAQNPLIDGALQYIRENYKNDISLTVLAEHLSSNASYLSRILKQETGENFTEILTNIRISKAKQLLVEPGSRITEVCEQVGYSDYSYFYQVFKKVENISPSEYKKLGKKV